jgi:hypothetical protein
MNMNRTIQYCAVLAAFTLGASVAMAQESRGAIGGQVTDGAGAVVTGVTVVVTNTEIGQSLKLETNESGNYNAPLLAVGTYRIEVEHPGFKKFVQDRIAVRVADRLQVDIKLEVGAVTENVTVSGGAPIIQAVDSSLGQVIDSRSVAELPIAHGNPYQLIALAPGVSYDGNAKLNRSFEPAGIVAYSMAGTRNNTTDVTMDGVVNTAVSSGANGNNTNQITAGYVPPADAVAEFRVQTSAFDSKIGQSLGGVTSINLKSGTNTPHGTLYYSKMPPGMMAADFFSNANRLPAVDVYYNRYGGSLNGPVFLPKLYKGRDRTFFMFAYEGMLEGKPRPPASPITVPTDAFRKGDFSTLAGAIYNPFTRRQEGGRIRSDPFPNNVIPQNLINPVASKVLNYIPAPLTQGDGPEHLNNFPKPNELEDVTYNSYVARIDHSTSEKNRFYVRGNTHKKTSGYNDWFNSAASGNRQPFFSKGGAFDDVYTLSPTTVLNVRYGYTRYTRQTEPLRGRNFDLTTIGLPASLNGAIPGDLREFPFFNVRTGSSTMFSTLNIGEDRNSDVHTLVGAVTKTHGSHTFEFGHEFRSYRFTRYIVTTTGSGAFDFDETYTRGPLDNSPIAPMQGFAAFLLGLPTPFASNGQARSYLVRNTSYAEQSTAWMFYFQDTWRATRKLNVTLGARYELEGPLTERYNRSVRAFDPTLRQPNEQAARAAYAARPIAEVPASSFAMRGGYTFAGVNGQPRTLWDRVVPAVMPRIGFAYSMNDKTVFRGAYGIFFSPLGVRRSDVSQAGFSRQTPIQVTNDGINFATTMSNPFPAGISEPQGAGFGAETDLGQQLIAFNPQTRVPYMQRWQFSVQREILPNTVIDVAYVGNRGTHLESELTSGVTGLTTGADLNALPLEYLSKSTLRDQSRIDTLQGLVANPFYGLPNMGSPLGTNTTLQRQVLMRPYPQFGPIIANSFDGYSWYHGLQARVERRYSAGLTTTVGYTWSKFMEATVRLNSADPRPSEGVAAQDHPHRVTVSTIYEVPIGRNRKLLPKANRLVDGLVGGWQLQGIYTYQSGSPLQWGPAAIFTNGSEIALNNRDPRQWFNTKALVTAANLRPDVNNYRTWPLRFSTLRAEGINNFDLSATKKWNALERLSVEFRGEFLNAMNHTRFGVPSTDPSSGLFGQVTQTAGYSRIIQLQLRAVF